MLTDGRRTDDGRTTDGGTDDGRQSHWYTNSSPRSTTDGRTDGRTTDARVTGILIAHLGAFGSGELKIVDWDVKNQDKQNSVDLGQDYVLLKEEL